MKCAISRPLIERLRSEAEAAGNREICGLLLGAEGRIQAAVAIPNIAADPERRFALEPAAHLRASREARAAGLRVVGHYHSHPGGDAAPSPADAAQAGEQGLHWLILAAGRQSLWRSRAGGALLSAFDAVELEIAAVRTLTRLATV
jgi:proteasome lid subunit RPN8/RPN11